MSIPFSRLTAALDFLGFTYDEIITFQQFVEDVFVDISGGNLERKDILMAYKCWMRFSPGRTILRKPKLCKLIQLKDLQQKFIKEEWS